MKRYRNIGTAPLGITSPSIEPGSEFSADLDSQQERSFRVSLRDAGTPRQPDHKRLWVTRSRIEISIEA